MVPPVLFGLFLFETNVRWRRQARKHETSEKHISLKATQLHAGTICVQNRHDSTIGRRHLRCVHVATSHDATSVVCEMRVQTVFRHQNGDRTTRPASSDGGVVCFQLVNAQAPVRVWAGGGNFGLSAIRGRVYVSASFNIADPQLRCGFSATSAHP